MNQIELLLTSILAVLNDLKKLATPTATQAMIRNWPVSAANQETRLILPQNIRKFTAKARGGDIQLAFAQGESNNNYILIPSGSTISEDLLNTYMDGFYFQSSNANAVLEVITWRA